MKPKQPKTQAALDFLAANGITLTPHPTGDGAYEVEEGVFEARSLLSTHAVRELAKRLRLLREVEKETEPATLVAKIQERLRSRWGSPPIVFRQEIEGKTTLDPDRVRSFFQFARDLTAIGVEAPDISENSHGDWSHSECIFYAPCQGFHLFKERSLTLHYLRNRGSGLTQTVIQTPNMARAEPMRLDGLVSLERLNKLRCVA